METTNTVQKGIGLDYLCNKAMDESTKVKELKSKNVIDGFACPIIWFGDMEAYFRSDIRVVTVGLNPSCEEFEGNHIRFIIPKEPDYANGFIYRAYNGYFHCAPYDRWFRYYERILQCLNCGVSYGGNKLGNPAARNVALHIDFYSSFATMPTWGAFGKEQKAAIKSDLFSELYDFLKPDIVLFSFAKNDILAHFQLTKGYMVYEDEKFVEVYHKERTFFIWGRNFNGAPWGSVSDVRCNNIFPQINDILIRNLHKHHAHEGVFWRLHGKTFPLIYFFDEHNRSHFDIWELVKKEFPEYARFDYEYFPRGRVWIKDGKATIFAASVFLVPDFIREVRYFFHLGNNYEIIEDGARR